MAAAVGTQCLLTQPGLAVQTVAQIGSAKPCIAYLCNRLDGQAGLGQMIWVTLAAARKLNETDRRLLMDHCLRHNVAYQQAAKICGVGMLPKHHLFFHLTDVEGGIDRQARGENVYTVMALIKKSARLGQGP